MSWSLLSRVLLGALLFAPALAGCIEPAAQADVDAAGDASLPTISLPETITGLAPAANVAFGGGNDLAFEGDYAYVSSGSGVHIVDISDPDAPIEVAVAGCSGKDIDVVQLETRRIVVVSSQSNDGCSDAAPKGGIRLIDVTNPKEPVILGQVALKYGSHTMTPYGDTGLVYNSAYNLASNPAASPLDHHRSEIVDVSDPEDPKVVGEFIFPDSSTSIGCHDILAEPARDRAICAGISETMIWDTTDPLAPKVVSTIHNPKINIHHSAATARDGDLLILGDEFAGVIVPACHPADGAPTGAIWFYDISDVNDPKELGFLPPPPGEAGRACTAHNFNVVEDRDLLVAGFYTAGTVLVDFSDPANPVRLDQQVQDGTNTWAAYYYRGAVYAGDGGRGLDVYRLI